MSKAWTEVTYRSVSESTRYAGGLYEKKLNGDVTKYYEFAGRRIAMRTQVAALGAIEAGANCLNSSDDDADTVVNDGCARYLLADHLGSTSTVVDRNGATATVKYWPYGATRSTTGTPGTDKLYTGQQDEPNDPALGLYNYNARFYSTTLGRFVSADPLVGSASDPQSWNGYAYVRNNPLRYTDPTGLCIWGLACTPTAALSFLACAQSDDGCIAALNALGEWSPEVFSSVRRLAVAALQSFEFWDNFLKPDANPFWGNYEAADTGFVGHPLTVGLVWQSAGVLYDRLFPSGDWDPIGALVDWINDVGTVDGPARSQLAATDVEAGQLLARSVDHAGEHALCCVGWEVPCRTVQQSAERRR